MKRDVLDFIDDIIEAIDDLATFTQGMKLNDFKQDKRTIYAVIRALELMGEAVKNLPDELRQTYDQVPWKRIAGMRDMLVHQYFGVEVETVWKVAKEDAPALKKTMLKIQRKLNEES